MQMLSDLIKQRNITMYRLSKDSGVPYTTVNDLCSGRTSPAKCSAETMYRIAQTLDVTVEELVGPFVSAEAAAQVSAVRPDRDAGENAEKAEKSFCSFELFKGNVCHRLKENGDIDFLIHTLEEDEIRRYYRLNRYRECLYLLGMVDYISRENEIPLCRDYDDLRMYRLEEPLFPSDVLVACAAAGNEEARNEALRNAIPEFMRFNIVECEVRDVV